MHGDHQGKHILLAKTPGCGEISVCGCGVISLHLGNVTVRLESTALLQLEQMIQNAMDNLCDIAAMQAENADQPRHIH